MVAIVAGNGLGLQTGSRGVLGAEGALGQAVLGQNGAGAYVNAATGNLVLQGQDEILVGRGDDIALVRTYNSQASFDFDNNDGWQLSLYKKLSGLSGWYNLYGSSIQLTDADGVVRSFAYDSESGLYQNRDGAGALDTLRYDSATNRWTYVDGDGHWSETFEVSSTSGEWRILSHLDADGQGYTYEYDGAGLIAKLTNTNGEQTVLTYNAAKQLQQVEVKTGSGTSAKTTLRVRYTYDASNRLQTVGTDLTPADGSIADGKTFVTTYTYDGASKRVASLRNSDGTEVAFAYDASGRVQTITDGAGKKTTFTYGSGSTQVQDALGQVTTLYYDTSKQLTRIVGPSGSGVDQAYAYNANGDVIRITDSRGNAVTCEYDARGNLTRRQDAAGNVLTRSYSADNLLLSESVNGQTTRYVYDVKQHLRFVLSPENRVTEYVYDGNGQRTREIQHGALVGETPLGTALLSQDFSSNTNGFTYVQGGSWDGSFTLANGKLVVTPKSGYYATETILTGSNTRAAGTVFQAEVTLGPSAAGRNFTFGAQFATSTYAAAAYGHRVVFDSNGKAVALWSNGQASTAVLGTVANGATYVVEVWTDAQGSTLYVYEKGKTRGSGWSDRRDFSGWSVVKSIMATPTGASGQIESPVYVDNYVEAPQPDLSTWLTGWSANADKRAAEVVHYGYDGRGQVSTVTRYTQVAQDGTPVGTGATTTFVRDAAGRLLQSFDALQNATTYLYDGLGRLLTRIDATGNITSTAYDDAGRRITVQQAGGLRIESIYDKRGLLLSRSERSATQALSTQSFAYDAVGRLRVATGADGGKTYYFYDAAGRKSAEIDPAGAYTEWEYNKAGQVVQRRRYANPVSANLATLFVTDADGQMANVAAGAVRPVQDASRDPVSRSLYDAAGRLVLSIDDLDLSGATRQSAVTRYTYDGAGRLVATTRYANFLTNAASLDGLGREAKPEDVGFITGAPAAGQIAVQLDAARDRVTRAFYSADGLLRGRLDAEGYLTEFFYDAQGRRTGSLRYATATHSGLRASGSLDALRPAAAAQDQRTSVFYDSRGQVVAEVDAEGYLTRYGYDANGNRTSTQRYADRVNAAQWAARNLEGLLPAGSAYRQTRTGYTALNQVLWQEDVDGTVTRFTYDADGRLLSSGRGWTFSGSTLVATDVRTRTQRYDLQGRLIGELDGVGSAALAALGATPTAAQVATVWASYGTTYVYDAAGRRSQRVDANGNLTLYFYDADHRLTYTVARVRNPANAAEWLGEVSARQYDALGEVTAEIRYANRIAAAKMLTLTGGADAQVKAAGVIVADAAQDSRTDTTYTLAGQVKRSTVKLNATENAVTERSYTAFGELSVRTTSLDATRTRREDFAYDRRGLLTLESQDVAWSGHTAATGATRRTAYDAFGRVMSNTDGNGITHSAAYDKLGRQIQTVSAAGSLNLTHSTTYDAFGRVLTQTDALGKTTTTSYAVDTATGRTTVTMTSPEGIVTRTVSDRHGQVVTLADGLGNETRYAYDANGRLLTVKRWDKAANAETTLQADSYDAVGQRLSTRDANGTVTAYSFDAAGRLLTRTVDPTGLKLTTSYAYDAQGRAVRMTDANGTVTQSTYDLAGRLVEVAIDPAGLNLRTRYGYDLAGHQITVIEGYGTAQARTTQHTYDSLNRRTRTVVDPAGLALTTTYAYDPNGNLVTQVEAAGTALARTTRYAYDNANRLVYTVDALGSVVRNDYDGERRLLQRTAYVTAINLGGLATAPSVTAVAALVTANATLDRTIRHIYDKDGRERFIIDAKGGVHETRYDAAGNVIKRITYATPLAGPLTLGSSPAIVATAPASGAYVLTSGNDQATTYTYDALNRLVSTTDALGNVTRNTYDAVGNLIQKNEAWGLPEERVTLYVYDKAGRVTDLTDAVGSVTHYDYDAAGRVTDTTTAYNTALAATLHRTYDSAGRLTAETRAYGKPEASTTRYSYNALGQQVAIIDPRGVELSETDSDWAKAQRLALGYVVSVRAKLASELSITEKTALAALYTTRQEFDAAGRKTASIDPLGNRTQTEYDAFGNIVKVIDPRGSAGYFYYDAANRLVLQVDPAGGIAKTTYNAFGDVKSVIRYAKPAQGTWNVATQPQIVADAAHDQKTETTTDILGRRKEIKTWFGSGANDYYTESFTYDAWGNVTQAVGKNGAATSYEYDALGRKTREILPVTSKNASGVETKVENRYEYDALGNLTKKTEAYGLPEQRVTVFAYDRLNRMVKETLKGVPLANGTVSDVSREKTWDKAGNLIKETDFNGNATYRFYDAQNREIGTLDGSGAYVATSYDTSGNRTARTAYANRISGPVTAGTRPTVFATSPTSTPAGAWLLADAANDRVVRRTYDAANREIGTEIPNVEIGRYDGAAGSYQIVNGSISTAKVYDANGNLIKETDPNGNVTWSVYDAAGRRVAQVDARRYLTTWEYDALGQTLKETRYANAVDAAFTLAVGMTLSALQAKVAASGDDRISVFAYDGAGRRLEERRKSVGHDAGVSDSVTAYTYNGLNLVTRITNALGEVTDYSYDAAGRLVKVELPTFTDAAGTQVRERTVYAYDGLNGVTSETRLGKDDSKTTDDRTSTRTYIAGRLRSETDATQAKWEFSYDANGNVTARSQQRRDADNAVYTVSTEYTYDGANRQLTTTDVATGTVEKVAYNAFGEISQKGTNGFQQSSVYDRAGRLIATNAGGAWEAYRYDASGNATARFSSAGVGLQGLSASQLQAGVTAGTVYARYSTYDASNHLVNTVEPAQKDNAASFPKIEVVPAGGVQVVAGDTGSLGRTLSIRVLMPAGAYTGKRIKISADLLSTPTAQSPFAHYDFEVSGDSPSAIRGDGIDVYQVLSTDPQPPTSYTLAVKVYEVTDQGNSLIVDSRGSVTTGSHPNGLNGYSVLLSAPTSLRDGLRIMDLPANTSQVSFRYRPKGSTSDYTAVAGQAILAGTQRVTGAFTVSLANIPAGDYEYLLESRDASSNVIDVYSGSMPIHSSSRIVSVTATSPTPADWINDFNANPQQFLWLATDAVGKTRLVVDQTAADSALGANETGWLWVRPQGSTGDYQLIRWDVASDGSLRNSASLEGLPPGNYEFKYVGSEVRKAAISWLPSTTINTQIIGTLAIAAASPAVVILAARGTGAANVTESQAWNAFGEVTSHTDALGNIERYTYNALGKLTKREQPETTATLANGSRVRVVPTTVYTYDLAGNVLSTRDPNQTSGVAVGSTRQKIQAGHVIEEQHADGGVKSMAYNEFGEQVAVTDEIGKVTRYGYDAMGRLIRIDRPIRTDGTATFETYTYDEGGQRISHRVAQNASMLNAEDKTEKTYFDTLGRITKTKAYTGVATTTGYIWDATIGGSGGWKKTTTLADGKTAIDATDAFGRLRWHKDYGGHTFDYRYDAATGWLAAQTSSTGQSIGFEYYADGKLRRRADYTEGSENRVGYDIAGRVAFEAYGKIGRYADDQAQSATITYDELGRIKRIVDPKYTLDYEYDANGNRRRVKSVYSDISSNTTQTQDYWYTYDAMNRFLISQGSFCAGSGSLGSSIVRDKGYSMSYNRAGQRIQQVGPQGTESYEYTADGYLENTKIDNVLRAWRRNDAVGNVVEYKEFSGKQVETSCNYETGVKTYDAEVTSWHRTTYDDDNRAIRDEIRAFKNTLYTSPLRTVRECYVSGTVDTHYAADGTVSDTFYEQHDGTTVTTRYVYDWWDDAKTKTIKAQAKNDAVSNWAPGYSNFTYDANGHVRKVRDEAGNRELLYVTDADGRILRRTETEYSQFMPDGASRTRAYYFAGGRPVGEASVTPGDADAGANIDYARQAASPCYANHIGPVKSADFDQNLQRISADYPGKTSRNYVVQAGDTLQGIALAVWGNASLWYLIADANGLSSDADLVAGMNITLPNKVTNAANTSTTFRPYDPTEAMGDVQPTIPDPPPPPDDDDCGGIGQIIVAVVTVVVAVFAPQMIQALAALMETMPAVAAAISAGIGNIAGQVVANAIGIQDGFSWSSLATAAISAGLTQGLMPSGLQASGSVMTATELAKASARAMISNVIYQGVANLTGQQHGFSWASVAAAAIAAPIKAAVAEAILGPTDGVNGPRTGDWARENKELGRLVEAGTGALISAATRVAVVGGKVQWAAVAADALSSFAGDTARAAIRDGDGNGKAVGNAQGQKLPPGYSPGDLGGGVTPGTPESGLRLPVGSGIIYEGSSGQGSNEQLSVPIQGELDDAVVTSAYSRDAEMDRLMAMADAELNSRVGRRQPVSDLLPIYSSNGADSFIASPAPVACNSRGGDTWSSGTESYPVRTPDIEVRALSPLAYSYVGNAADTSSSDNLLRAPDFVSFQLGWYVFGVVGSFGRNGISYIQYSVARPYPAPKFNGVGAAVAVGWVNKMHPTSDDLNNLLGGGSMGFTGGYFGVGGGFDYSPSPDGNNLSGTYVGLGFGGFAWGAGNGMSMGDTGIKW